jgi:hypothetical protein
MLRYSVLICGVYKSYVQLCSLVAMEVPGKMPAAAEPNKEEGKSNFATMEEEGVAEGGVDDEVRRWRRRTSAAGVGATYST